MRLRSASKRDRSKKLFRPQGNCQPTTGTFVFSRVARADRRRDSSTALTPSKLSEWTVTVPASLHARPAKQQAATRHAKTDRRMVASITTTRATAHLGGLR